MIGAAATGIAIVIAALVMRNALSTYGWIVVAVLCGGCVAWLLLWKYLTVVDNAENGDRL